MHILDLKSTMPIKIGKSGRKNQLLIKKVVNYMQETIYPILNDILIFVNLHCECISNINSNLRHSQQANNIPMSINIHGLNNIL